MFYTSIHLILFSSSDGTLCFNAFIPFMYIKWYLDFGPKSAYRFSQKEWTETPQFMSVGPSVRKLAPKFLGYFKKKDFCTGEKF